MSLEKAVLIFFATSVVSSFHYFNFYRLATETPSSNDIVSTLSRVKLS